MLERFAMGLTEEQVVRELLHDQSRLTSFAWSLVSDAHLADDIFQEVCLEAIRKRAEIQDISHLSRWALQTIRFRAVDALRSDTRRRMLNDAVIDNLQSRWQRISSTESSQSAEALRYCVTQLSPYAQQIVKLRYVDGRKASELAHALGRNVEAIYKALTRVHRQLEACIRQQLER